MAFSQVMVFSKCECATTSMKATKMPNGIYHPAITSFELVAGLDEPIKIAINLTGDTISWVCGNSDGYSFCGSDGSSASV